jgi:hypothetical protein
MPRWLPRVLARIHRLAAQGKVQFTQKALRELEALDLGLNEHDGGEGGDRPVREAGPASALRRHLVPQERVW